MTTVHSLEGPLRPDSAVGRAPTPSASARPEPPRTPIRLDPPRPAWARQPGMEARAQTWVQITLLLVIGALVAFVMALPEQRLSRAAIEAQRSFMELRLTLAELRTVIGDYHADRGAYPGHGLDGEADPDWFDRQWKLAIQRTDARGELGVELRTRPITSPSGVPTNPINGLSSVRFLRADEPWPQRPDDATGWIYQPSTGEIRANTAGTSPWSGTAYWDL